MYPRLLLSRSARAMQSDPCSDSIWRNQDREAVNGTREPNDLVSERCSPECNTTIDIVGTQHDGPEAQHDASLARYLLSELRL